MLSELIQTNNQFCIFSAIIQFLQILCGNRTEAEANQCTTHVSDPCALGNQSHGHSEETKTLERKRFSQEKNRDDDLGSPPISTLKQMMTLLQRTYDVIERISSEAGYQVAVDLGWYYVIKMETNIKNEIVPRCREFPRPKSTDDTHFVLDMPYNHEVGPVKEIMIVNFDDTYGLNVRVESSCGKASMSGF